MRTSLSTLRLIDQALSLLQKRKNVERLNINTINSSSINERMLLLLKNQTQ